MSTQGCGNAKGVITTVTLGLTRYCVSATLLAGLEQEVNLNQYIYIEDVPGPGIRVKIVTQVSPIIETTYFAADDGDEAHAFVERIRKNGSVVVSTVGMTAEQLQIKRDRDEANVRLLIDSVRATRATEGEK